MKFGFLFVLVFFFTWLYATTCVVVFRHYSSLRIFFVTMPHTIVLPVESPSPITAKKKKSCPNNPCPTYEIWEIEIRLWRIFEWVWSCDTQHHLKLQQPWPSSPTMSLRTIKKTFPFSRQTLSRIYAPILEKRTIRTSGRKVKFEKKLGERRRYYTMMMTNWRLK